MCSYSQYWRQVYLLAVLALMLAVFFAQIHPLYLSQPWRKLRSLIVCSLAAYGLLPTMHWVWISGGFSSEPTQVSTLPSMQHSPSTAQHYMAFINVIKMMLISRLNMNNIIQ